MENLRRFTMNIYGSQIIMQMIKNIIQKNEMNIYFELANRINPFKYNQQTLYKHDKQAQKKPTYK